MKKIKTQTVRMTVDAEVLPLSSALVSRIVSVATRFNLMASHGCFETIRTYGEFEDKTIRDTEELLQDIYHAFAGEDEKKPETTDEPIGTREQPKQPKF